MHVCVTVWHLFRKKASSTDFSKYENHNWRKMFFRRILERKDTQVAQNLQLENRTVDGDEGQANDKDNNNNSGNNNNSNNISAYSGNGFCKIQQRKFKGSVIPNERYNSDSPSSVQLSPLWEHILRTRRLPETICPVSMFTEFHERLQDPEWQVRQHALRVLVDVLVVMGVIADKHMEKLTPQIVDNLGHQAPTVRKGALDCLRVYLSETAMPDTIMLHILDVGLNRKPDEPFGSRLTCGIMLSLPALLQSILHTTKRHFILNTTIEMLVLKMSQLMYQEITLKVLSKIRELIGEIEFSNYMSNGGFDEYEHLCKIYGLNKRDSPLNIGTKAGAWRALQKTHSQESCWRAPSVKDNLKSANCPEKSKVIMETEIKINDDTLTMRIVEADTEVELDSPCADTNIEYANSFEGEIVCRPLASAKSDRQKDGILQVISDSDVDDHSSPKFSTLSPMTPTRALKRVTFGGEIVKMRTPDSDAASSTNMIVSKEVSGERKLFGNENNHNGRESELKTEELPAVSVLLPSSPENVSTQELTLDIPSDNTKPIVRPKSTQTHGRPESRLGILNTSDSQSPRSPYRCKSISPVDSIISPKAPHKEIEVLHNLQQRDASPSASASARSRRNTIQEYNEFFPKDQRSQFHSPTVKTWEDLAIVGYTTLMDMRSGDWRNRQRGFTELALALRSSNNLALVQPYLDTLLRALLSSERNCEVSEVKRDLLANMITRLPLDNLEDRTLQILNGLCRQGNAGANRVCKALMQRLPAGTIAVKLTSSEFLHAKSSKFREHALKMAIYALMTFPSSCFDPDTCVTNAVYAALNPKRRVRQAALEVLAVLDAISDHAVVLNIVKNITTNFDEAVFLLSAVKTRISRKQLPETTPEDSVIYTVKYDVDDIDKSGTNAADVEWILMGEGGSASPTSKSKRKALQLQKRVPGDHRADTVYKNCEYHPHKDSFGSSTDVNGESNPYTHKYNYSNFCQQMPSRKSKAFYASFMDRNMMHKTCSDSSMDGRSSDSTNTCSSGSGSFIQAPKDTKDGSGRFTRLTSRFPTMNQIELGNHFTKSMRRSTTHYSGKQENVQLQTQKLNSSDIYPKINYTLSKPSHKKLEKQATFTQQRQKPIYAIQGFKHNEAESTRYHNSCETPNNSYFFCKKLPIANHKDQSDRFVNTDGIEAAEQRSKETTEVENPKTQQIPTLESKTGSPISVKSTFYSQKSTASAKSSYKDEELEKKNKDPSEGEELNTSEMKSEKILQVMQTTLDAETEEHILGALVVDDLEMSSVNHETALKRDESINSLHSKTESIKTQLEDTPTTLSRAQSPKSLVIEEEIEDSNSFVVVEEIQNELNSPRNEILSRTDSSFKQSESNELNLENAEDGTLSNIKNYSMKITEIHAPSRTLSLDSFYERPLSKQDSLDTSNTDFSSQSSNQLYVNSTPTALKSRPSLTKEKSKTSYFLRGHRRVSPAKQAVKLSRTELLPQNTTNFEKPREALLKTFDQLDSSNWEVNMLGLQAMVRLIRYHSEYLENQMHMVCIQLTRSVRNLRSQVARSACQAAAELFSLKSKYLEQECDDLICALLQRTADTNRFIRADAARAVESMVDHLHPLKVLNILTSKGVQHQNALVRTTTAKMLNRLVDRLGCDKVFAMTREHRDKFFVVGANLLLEGSLETRSYAKALFRSLSEHSTYQRILLEVIPSRTYRNIEKTLKNITR